MKLEALLHKVYGTTPNDGNLQPKEAVAYAVAGFGQNFICTIIGSYLTIFMTDALLFGSADVMVGGISGAMAVAYLMLGTRIFDACNDPIMGSIVDKTRTKYGKCRPYLKWMAIPIAIMTLLCFNPFVEAGTVRTFVYIAVVYVIWSVVYTVVDVPYWALSSSMTNNTIVRGNLLTVTRLVCTLGAGIVTVGVPIITDLVTAKYKDETGTVLPEFIYDNANALKWVLFHLRGRVHRSRHPDVLLWVQEHQGAHQIFGKPAEPRTQPETPFQEPRTDADRDLRYLRRCAYGLHLHGRPVLRALRPAQ